MNPKPKIGITLGDVAGIGPEVAVKALLDPAIEERCIPVLVGELSTIEHYARKITPGRKIKVLDDPQAAMPDRALVQIIDLKNIDFAEVPMGQIDQRCGSAALDFIRAGVDLCLQK